MNNDDFKKIKTIVREEVSSIVKKELGASEKRLKEEMSASDRRVMADIGQFMEDNLFPMIDVNYLRGGLARTPRDYDPLSARILMSDCKLSQS